MHSNLKQLVLPIHIRKFNMPVKKHYVNKIKVVVQNIFIMQNSYADTPIVG